VSEGDEGRNMGTPEEVGSAYEHFRATFRQRAMTPEEEAAMGLAIELSDAEIRAFVEMNRASAMAAEFPEELRETVLSDLAQAMSLAEALHRSWSADTEPGDLLASARALRDAAAALATKIEALWPGSPPPDYSRDFLADG
jgi:hypothetical protein